jgi:DNA-binding PadR family transcriptional regulator
MGDETTGARRRYYSITRQGRVVYEKNIADWDEAKTLIDELIREVDV